MHLILVSSIVIIHLLIIKLFRVRFMHVHIFHCQNAFTVCHILVNVHVFMWIKQIKILRRRRNKRLLSLPLIFLSWVWTFCQIDCILLTFPFISWPCCSGKCVLHMYIEVELGLIAVHTQPEDITMWSASIVLPLKKKMKIRQPWVMIMWECYPPKHSSGLGASIQSWILW